MVNVKKRLLSSVLTAAMAASYLPVMNAFAAEETTTANGAMLWSAEFDGNDDMTYWANTRDGNRDIIRDFTEYITDGMLVLNPGKVAYGRFAADGRAPDADAEGRLHTVKGMVDENGKPVLDDKGNQKEEVTRYPSKPFIDVKDKTEVIFETRMKLVYPEANVDENGYIITSDDGFLMLEGQDSLHNVVTAIRSGKLAYGGSRSKSEVITDKGVLNNVWYTYRITCNFLDKKMKFGYTNEKGESYDGDWVALMPYGYTLENIYAVNFNRQLTGNMTTYIDYGRVWDNTMLPEVKATYGDGLDLNGAVNMPSDFTANIAFENPITDEDMENIIISSGVECEKALSADGKNVTLNFTNLDYSIACKIDIPSMNLNKAVTVKFVTASEPWYLFKAEFDGNDDMSHWASFQANGIYRDENSSNYTDYGVVQGDGTLMVTNMNTGTGFWGVYYGAKENALQIPKDKQNIYLETRFMTTTDYTGNSALIRMYGNRVSDGTEQEFFQLTTTGNTIAGKNENGEDVSYSLSANTWFTLKVRIDFSAGKAYYTVSDDNGNQESFVLDFVNRSLGYTDISKFMVLCNHPNINEKRIDYVRLWDDDLIPRPEITYGDNGDKLDGAGNVKNGDKVSITFPTTVSEADISSVKLDGKAVDGALSADKKSIIVDLNGLEARKKYTLTVDAVGALKTAEAAFRCADEEYYLFRAEFDGKDDTSRWAAFDQGGTYREGITAGELKGDGTLMVNSGKTGFGWWGAYFGTQEKALQVPKEKENIYVETRFKTTTDYGSMDLIRVFGTRLSDGADLAFLNIKATDNAIVGKDEGGKEVSYPMSANVWYTIRARLDFSTETAYFTVSDDNGNQESFKWNFAFKGLGNKDISSLMVLRNNANVKDKYIDYVRLWDDDLIPGAEVTYGAYNEELNGAGSVKDGDIVTVAFPDTITEENLTAIKLNGNAVNAELLSDNKTVKIALNNLGTRTFHTLTVDAIGMNKALECKFRSADEDKYLYRTEFDGYDDDSVWYSKVNERSIDLKNSAASDGVYTYSYQTTPYRAFYTSFKPVDGEVFDSKAPKASQAIDCTGKENVTLETKVKVGEGILDKSFISIGNMIGELKITDGNVLNYYDGVINEGKAIPFTVYDEKFRIEPDVWYSITFRLDFAAHKYSVSVDDGKGNIVNSGVLNFIFNRKENEISNVRFSRMLNADYAPMTIDYVRIIDEDYGKVNVTYGNDGVKLDSSAVVGINDSFFFDSNSEDISGITLTDDKGNNTAVTVSSDNGKVTVTPETMNYNTKYTLTIPASVTGAEDTQIVTFTTEWNANAEFVYPAGYSADDALNVVFFGGSITYQEGWRKYTTDWMKEKFPNANCYNASVGGTGAAHGWTRLNRDVISKNPDIVFVEYAVNDSSNPETTKYMESIVRNLNALDKPPVIIFVYTTVLDFNTNIYAISEHERIAKAYGIPSISIHDYMQSLYNTDSTFAADWDAKKYLNDSTHPTMSGEYNGSKLYGDYVTALLSSDSAKYFVKPTNNAFVTPLTDYKNYVYNYDVTDVTLSEIGEAYTYNFAGDEFAIEYKKGKNNGIFSVAIDGEVVSESVDTYIDGSYPNSKVTYTGLGNGAHTAVITVTGKNAGSAGSNVGLYCMYTLAEAKAKFSTPVFDKDTVVPGTAVNVAFNYLTVISKPVVLVAVTYDENGKLTGMTTAETVTEAAATEKQMKLTVTPKAGDKKIKAFVWNSLKEMKPLASAGEL